MTNLYLASPKINLCNKLSLLFPNLQLATELRVPIWNTQTYGFLEYGTDLGSSKDLRGNPTEFFRRAGSGMSYGVGVKLGLMRAEYARDCNTGSGSLFVRFGERF